MDTSELDRVYRNYGFEVEKISNNLRAYLKRSGYFNNADIVPVGDTTEDEIETTKSDLESSGYASTVRRYESVREAKDQLFKGFFAADSNRTRLVNEYKRFAKSISDSIGSKYSYVDVDYNSSPKIHQDISIVDTLHQLLSREKSCFIILEAPAGFGKTCTTFEVLNKFLHEDSNRIPIITRFSLNRQAKIFRYVLLDEIDRNFPSLDSSLVQSKIKEGRTPLLLDGFDELISRGEGLDDRYEDAEPMLQTIGKLLTDHAKVLLTTRKTAIFSESEFDEWRSTHAADADVYRIELEDPTVLDWLGPEKTEIMKESDIPLDGIANPVVLAYLRGLDRSEFEEMANEPSQIVDRYFEQMLDREKQRQELRLDVDEQRRVFQDLAENMIQETFTADSKEYIQLRIHEKNRKLLERARGLYSGEERPTTEELASKLSNHALLNRQGGQDQIGFVNDFVLGTLAGDAIRDGATEGDPLDDSDDPPLFIDTASTAYATQIKRRRNSLWEKLRRHRDKLNDTEELALDLRLKRDITRDLEDAYIEGLSIRNVCLGKHRVHSVAFLNCKFDCVTIRPRQFRDVTFQKCRFNNVFVWPGDPDSVSFHDCSSYGNTKNQIKGISSSSNYSYYSSEYSGVLAFREYVILNCLYKNFQGTGSPRLPRNLFQMNLSEAEIQKITDSIQRLSERDVIKADDDYIVLRDDRIDVIESLLED